MSTLMSKDLHISRPSIRLYASPGGNSSLSLGDGITNIKPNRPVNNRVNNNYEKPPSPIKASQPSNNITNNNKSNVLDPKLRDYMDTLDPADRKLFESMVDEEMSKLNIDTRDDNSSNSNNKSGQSYDYYQSIPGPKSVENDRFAYTILLYTYINVYKYADICTYKYTYTNVCIQTKSSR